MGPTQNKKHARANSELWCRKSNRAKWDYWESEKCWKRTEVRGQCKCNSEKSKKSICCDMNSASEHMATLLSRKVYCTDIKGLHLLKGTSAGMQITASFLFSLSKVP